jgi:hypothetical protein
MKPQNRKVLVAGSCVIVGFVLAPAIHSVLASNCPPIPAGKNGCRCAPAGCAGGDVIANPCMSGWCNSNSDCWGGNTTNGYWVTGPTDPKVCIGEGPGGGCTSAAEQAICKKEEFCDCDWDFGCQSEYQRVLSHYIPCT